MARIKVEISKSELETVIQDLETNNGAYKNRSALHEAVANTSWARNFEPKPITPAVVGLRIAEFGIEPLTPKGRVGMPPGVKRIHDPEKRKNKKKALFANPKTIDIYNNLEKMVPESLKRTLERAKKGSLQAAVKINCAHCVGFECIAENVRSCSANLCPIYPFRPYQNLTIKGQDVDDDETDTDMD